MKKSIVAIHVMSFGDEDMGKHEKISALVAAANNNDNSHIVDVPPSGKIALSDVLVSSPILTEVGDDEDLRARIRNCDQIGGDFINRSFVGEAQQEDEDVVSPT